MRYLQVFMNKIYRLYYVFIYTFYIELMKKKKKKIYPNSNLQIIIRWKRVDDQN